ncbi:MAG: hypothetical protein WCC21_15190 [Candidatus Acidiferrales bacterium]
MRLADAGTGMLDQSRWTVLLVKTERLTDRGRDGGEEEEPGRAFDAALLDAFGKSKAMVVRVTHQIERTSGVIVAPGFYARLLPLRRAASSSHRFGRMHFNFTRREYDVIRLSHKASQLDYT